MKSILLSLLTLLCLYTYGQQEAPTPLRHFMQAGSSPANETQYGNNPKAGYYVNAGDVKIY